MKKALFALAFSFIAIPAFAGEPADYPLADRFNAVCESQAVKSDDLQAACAMGEGPKVLKDGSRFHNRGIGAEANVIWVNIDFFRTEKG